MGTEYVSSPLELKVVDPEQRIIEGWAAVAGNIDRVNDIIDPGAFTKTLSEKKPSDVGVFLAHNLASLPMGLPIELRYDGKGLYTKTLIKPTAEGDELLGTAKFMQEHGQPLGMSIGYRTRDAKYEKQEGKTVRRLLDIDLIEYSYAPSQTTANDQAVVSAVKTLMEKALSEGSDTSGGFLANGKDRKAELDAAARDNLDESAFAWIDSEGGKHLPINDAAHVRAAMARFGQTNFDSASAKASAWKKILAAAKKFDIDVEDESMPKAKRAPAETKIVSWEQVGKEVATLAKDVLDKADTDADPQDNRSNWCASVSTYPDYAVVCYTDWDGDDDDGDYYYQIAFMRDADGHVASIGTPVPVDQAWTPITSGGPARPKADLTPDETTVARWAAWLESKAGATMSNTHKGMLHDAMGALQKLHKTQCKDPNCKFGMDVDGADDSAGDSGGDSDAAKTLKAYREKFAAR